MQTREELLNNLHNAVIIIRKLGNIQQRLNQVRNKYLSHKTLSKFLKLVIAFWIFMAIYSLIIWADIFSIIECAIFALLAYIIKKFLCTLIDKYNEHIKFDNEQPILNDLREVQAEYRKYLSSWYPENYCSIEAAEFFYNSVKNFRADNIKEAINLYETTLHQRRVEANQEQALEQAIHQQKLNNLLSIGNFVMQNATLGEIRSQNARQTLAMQDANNTLNDIKNRLR